ncbi:MAG: DNA-binding protein [Candidatus Omnitrophica bacterium]|nr:DNA-binding protein [Candidatus Omnitrophota bacterium]
MKVKNDCYSVMVCLALVMSNQVSYGQILTSLDLLNNAKKYDSKTVTYKGEVIGDVMIRGDYSWVHVNDGAMALGIWTPAVMIRDIRYAGDYHKHGDIVEVVGVFHRSCPEHGGDLDIHASEIKKITPGGLIIRPVSRKKIHIGAYSLIAVLLFYVLKRFLQGKKVGKVLF